MQDIEPYPYAQTFEAAAVLYRARGLDVTPPRGNNYWGQHMVCAEHDGVPYCMNTNDCFGKLDPGKVDHVVRHRELTIQRHHALVKGVYEHCKTLGVGDIWVMCGGGGQLQAFFGNRKGYLAILYLTLESRSPAYTGDDLKSVGNEPATLQVQTAENDVLFQHCHVPGVRVRSHASVYGNR